MKQLRLRHRDMILLEALALRIRLISQKQAAEAFWECHIPNARRRLKQLAVAEFLQRASAPAQPLPEMVQPVVRWQPGQEPPNANRVSYRLKQRWKFRVLIPTIVYCATERTVLQFGGKARSQNKVTQVTHDLGLTATWIRYYQESSRETSFWVGEDVLAPTRRRQKLPDAALLDRSGNPALLIEFGGSYAADRVAAFHEDAASRQLPYHLW